MNSGEAQIPSQATVFRPTATYVHEAINGRFFVRRGNGEFLAQALIAVDEEHEVELRKEGYVPVLEAHPDAQFYCFLREELWMKQA